MPKDKGGERERESKQNTASRLFTLFASLKLLTLHCQNFEQIHPYIHRFPAIPINPKTTSSKTTRKIYQIQVTPQNPNASNKYSNENKIQEHYMQQQMIDTKIAKDDYNSNIFYNLYLQTERERERDLPNKNCSTFGPKALMKFHVP